MKIFRGIPALFFLASCLQPGEKSLEPPNRDFRETVRCFDNYDQGLAFAQKANKPLFVYFTGWAVINCRKMEQYVLQENSILPQLQNDYVVITLYTDDNKELPKEQQYTSSGGYLITRGGARSGVISKPPDLTLIPCPSVCSLT